MSEVVLADAQFSLADILRPFAGFEATYQGQPTATPVAFPGTLDVDAAEGVPGFSPYLLAGLEVPFGAKVVLWFPVVTTGNTLDGPAYTDYTYQIHWRLRNVADYRRRRKPYHLRRQTGGAQDTANTPVGMSPDRLIMPSALETVIYQRPEPASGTAGARAVGNLRASSISVPGDGIPLVPGFGAPLLPPGAPVPPAGPPPFGEMEQGITDPAQAVLGTESLFRPYFTVAKGDELIITAVRTDQTVDTWEFSAEDLGFSNTYGTNVAGPTHSPFTELGIYVLVGSNPS